MFNEAITFSLGDINSARKRSWGKVTFLHLSASHSVQGGAGAGGLYDVTPCTDRDPLYGKERAVRILLECIHVCDMSEQINP